MSRAVNIVANEPEMVAAVVNAIPFGRQNAISRTELVSKMGMSDRKVRQLIEAARYEGNVIVNEQSGAGYYQTEDLDEIERQYNQERARAMAILVRQKHLRRKLKQAGREVRW